MGDDFSSSNYIHSDFLGQTKNNFLFKIWANQKLENIFFFLAELSSIFF